MLRLWFKKFVIAVSMRGGVVGGPRPLLTLGGGSTRFSFVHVQRVHALTLANSPKGVSALTRVLVFTSLTCEITTSGGGEQMALNLISIWLCAARVNYHKVLVSPTHSGVPNARANTECSCFAIYALLPVAPSARINTDL